MASSSDSGINGVAGGTGSHEEELVFFFSMRFKTELNSAPG